MEEAQAPEEVVETTEEVATLEVEETTEAETLEEDTPEASTESTTETTAEDNKSGYERRQKFKAQRERADIAEANERLAKQELQHLKEQMYQNNQAAQPITPVHQQVQGDPNKPRLDQFDDVEDYMEADYNYRDAKRQAKHNQESQVKGFNALEKEYIANNKKYLDDVTYSKIKPTPIIAQEILRSKLGPELIHAFSKDPQLAVRLNSLHPSDAIRELIQLEEKVKLTPAVSSAPAPISTSKTLMPTGSKKYSEGQTQRDYAAEREAYIASKRR